MGNTRRIKRTMQGKTVMVKTGLVYGGSNVCIEVNDAYGREKATAFRNECLRNSYRSSLMNVRDMFAVNGFVRDKLAKGEPIWN